MNAKPPGERRRAAGQTRHIRSVHVFENCAARRQRINVRTGGTVIAVTTEMIWTQRINIKIQKPHNCSLRLAQTQKRIMQRSIGNKKIANATQDLILFCAEEHCLRWGARPSKPLRCDYVPGGFDSYLFRHNYPQNQQLMNLSRQKSLRAMCAALPLVAT